ncbi:MAG TPA: RiPP maturation radical SAM C-methyltransferase [Streptosporangiaceae bacterium]|jgi:ribosomal peptide maturation radical SAM protein 1
MKVIMISMPWNLLETPSLPLGILGTIIRGNDERHEVQEIYGNISWAEYLLSATDGTVTPRDYDYVANVGAWFGMGDWIFAPAFYGHPDWRIERYLEYLRSHAIDPRQSVRMSRYAAGFISLMAQQIAAAEPELLGFSTTFQQNIPSLALAKEVKRLLPQTPIVFGGGNCDAPMGAALQRNFPFVDYVISGEAERSVTEFMEFIQGLRPAREVSGLSWRDDADRTVTNDPGAIVNIETVPLPDYSQWSATLNASSIRGYVKPTLLYEAARGCWWGEKHTCTFCGLNGLTMKFRSRPADQVLAHLRDLVSTYRVLDIVAVDNILDIGYLKTLLPRLSDEDWDLHFYYEVKSNLSEADVEMLRRAGLVHIQPGIENLSSRVLRIMNKGVHATQNVRLLRDCEDNDITVDWNYLYGFPAESDDDYASVLEQLPALAHLQPPSGSVRILLERYSPYFTLPGLGFHDRRPAALYQHVYDLPPAELADLVYQFDTDDQGIGRQRSQQMRAAIRAWKDAYPASSLTCTRLPDGSAVITDRRVGWPERQTRLTPGAQCAAYEAMRTSRTVRAIAGRVGISAGQIAGWVREWRDLGLVFEDDGRVVALATRRASLKRFG